MPDSLFALRAELRAEPSPAVRALEDDDQRRLAELIRAAGERQQLALEAAIDHGLGFIPRLARGAVKKALFG